MYGLVTQLRALFSAVFVAAGVLFCPVGHALVISQIYGGGGNSGSTYTNDFIELFNNSPAPVDLNGMSVQYASSSGTTWQKTNLIGTLDPYHYYLIRERAGSGGTFVLPIPDATGSIGLNTSSGKVALVNDSILLSSANACLSSLILDLVGYGSVDCHEGTATASSPSNTMAASRQLGGLMDSNDNFSDFTLLAPNPRNRASPANIPVSTAPGEDINSVSEPTSLLLLAGGLTAILLRRRQRHATTCAA